MRTLDVAPRVRQVLAERGAPAARLFAAATRIATVLRGAGFQACFVGGAVRDLLLDRPIKDIDIATDADTAQVRKLFRKTIPVGESFAVVRVLHNRLIFEVASFRREEGYSDGRHPDRVGAGSLEEDLQRRDFTVNGLVLDPATLEVRDYVRGLDDLDAHIIRAIGDPQRRMSEDYLRTLRAVRFTACLRFRLDDRTFDAVRVAAPGLARISRERVRDEIEKMARQGGAARGLPLLVETGLFRHAFPFLPQFSAAPRAAADALLAALPERLDLTDLLAALMAAANPDQAMQERSPRTCAALAAQAGDPLRLSNDERSHLARILHVLSRLKTAAATRLARRADLFRSPGFETAATIATALLEHLGRDHSFVATLRQERRGLPPTRLDPPRLLDGTDIARLRIPKGPLYGQLLREVHDLTVEGTLCTRTQALRWLRKRTTGIRTQEPES